MKNFHLDFSLLYLPKKSAVSFNCPFFFKPIYLAYSIIIQNAIETSAVICCSKIPVKAQVGVASSQYHLTPKETSLLYIHK
jgi:hypothetical protein